MNTSNLGARLSLVTAIVLCAAIDGLVSVAALRPAVAADWPQVHSDLRADPAVVFGKLANGMRYAIMKNATPKGAVAMRFSIEAGSMQESDAQQGLAHFLEHMAFRGSRHVPENQVWPGLQRLGMMVGADANAFTAFTQTQYVFNLPLNDEDTVNKGLLRIRDIASELTLAQRAMDAERGVILSEERLRATPAFRSNKELFGQLFPGNIVNSRFVIGQTDIIKNAPVSLIRDYYDAYYRPERATLIVVGDIVPLDMKKKIVERFSDWKPVGPAGEDPKQPRPGVRGAEVGLFVEAGAASSLGLTWVLPVESDSKARERDDFIKLVAIRIFDYRLQELASGPRHPFANTSISFGPMLHTATLWSVGLDTQPQNWRVAVETAVTAARRMDEFGVTADEVARAVNDLRAALQAAAANAATRPSSVVANELAQSADDGDVFQSPAQNLSYADEIFKNLTKETVNAGLRKMMHGHGPLIRLSSPTPIMGGKPALEAVVAAALKAPLTAAKSEATIVWPYNKFGPVGQVVERKTIEDLQTTFVRFANGVRLTVKPTKFTEGNIIVNVRVGDGRLGLPPERYSPNWAVKDGLILGGLKTMSIDNINRALAGKVYRLTASINDDGLMLRGSTRPVDLATQLQLGAAYVSAPGWRESAIERARTEQANRLAKASGSPEGVFIRDIGALLHSGDRRWSTPSPAEVASLGPQDLKATFEATLASAPIEVVMVGDIAVDTAVQAVADTFGALPRRSEPAAPSAAAIAVHFPAATAKPVVLHHNGRADQGYAAMAWPTGDAFDPHRVQDLNVLKNAFIARMTDQLRSRDAATYSPHVEAGSSRVFPGYGVFMAFTELPSAKMPLFFNVTAAIAADFQAHPISADELERARKPILETIIADRQKNTDWAYELSGAQTDPRRLDLIRSSIPDLKRVTAADVQRVAQEYLSAVKSLKVEVIPEAAIAQ